MEQEKHMQNDCHTNWYNQYSRQEQEIIAVLQQSKITAQQGDIAVLLPLQAKLFMVLGEVVGNQTQAAFRYSYKTYPDSRHKPNKWIDVPKTFQERNQKCPTNP